MRLFIRTSPVVISAQLAGPARVAAAFCGGPSDGFIVVVRHGASPWRRSRGGFAASNEQCQSSGHRWQGH